MSIERAILILATSPFMLGSPIMQWLRHKHRLSNTAALAVIVVIAQVGAITHALQHDLATPKTHYICANCIAAQSTTSACVARLLQVSLEPHRSCPVLDEPPAIPALRLPLARQRAPPHFG